MSRGYRTTQPELPMGLVVIVVIIVIIVFAVFAKPSEKLSITITTTVPLRSTDNDNECSGKPVKPEIDEGKMVFDSHNPPEAVTWLLTPGFPNEQ